MAYQALYRKYRPANFAEVKGQEAIVRTLKNQLSSGHVGHAYLFCGTRGTGKTTVAKIFAKALNCENLTQDGPCCECDRCRSIEDGSSMNVIEIDGASNNKVEDIRNIIEEVRYAPADGGHKVYIIDEVHMVTPQGFNALLKTLEEPPEYVTFILATTDPQKVLPTILSRCQRYDFKRIPMETIIERMKELLDREGVQAQERALNYIARVSDGALRDALSLLEECISYYFGEELTFDKVLDALGAVDQTAFHELTSSIIACDVSEVIATTEKLTLQGKDHLQFARSYVWYLRNLLIVKTTEDVTNLVDLSDENISQLREYADKLEVEQIIRYIHVISRLIGDMRHASDRRVVFEIAMIRLCRPQMESDYDSLIDEIRSLQTEVDILRDRLEAGQFSTAPESRVSANVDAPPPEPVVIRPEAVPEDIQEVVKNWKHILQKIPEKFGLMRAQLSSVTLSIDEDSRLVLAFKDKFTKSEFESDGGDKINKLSDIISEAIGKQVTITTKDISTPVARLSTPDLTKMFKGIPVDIVD